MNHLLQTSKSLLMYGLCLLCCTSACQSSRQQQVSAGEEAILSFARDGAWCWFSDPRAVYYEGKHQRTYAGWVSSTGDVVVGYYDHRDKHIETHVLYPQLEVDDHDNPALLFSPEGKLMVFFSKHSRAFPIQMYVSDDRESIKDWKSQSLQLNDTITYANSKHSYTYVNPVFLEAEGNKLYLFWRGMDFKPNVAWSEDMGKSWSRGKIFIQPENIYSNRRPYLKVSSKGKDRIHFAFTDGHPRNEPTNSIYYAVYRDGAFFKANGSKIGTWKDLPLKPRQTDVVYDAISTNEKAWIWDVAEDSTGNPVIAYVRFPSDTVHTYYYARWNGSGWENHPIVEGGGWFPQTPEGKEEREPNYSGGLVLDHEHPDVVYLSKEVQGRFEIERWKTDNGGKSWDKQPITQNSKLDQVRPFAVRNAGKGNPLQVLWLSNRKYIHYTDYNSSVEMWFEPSNQ